MGNPAAAPGAVMVTTADSPWLYGDCPGCAHSFRVGDAQQHDSAVEEVQLSCREFRLQDAVQELREHGTVEPSGHQAKRCR
jgi:hypothetical protein